MSILRLIDERGGVGPYASRHEVQVVDGHFESSVYVFRVVSNADPFLGYVNALG